MNKLQRSFTSTLAVALALLLVPAYSLPAQPQITAEQLDQIEQQGPVDPSTLPPGPPFWMASGLINGTAAPLPAPPAGLAVYMLNTQPLTYIVDDVSDQGAVILNQSGSHPMSAVGDFSLTPPDDDGTNGVDQGDSSADAGSTNQFQISYPEGALLLAITNIGAGWVYLNLHGATGQVYAVQSASGLLANWQVESEVWPADTNCAPFALQTLDRPNLFVRVQDWTGVRENGNATPSWWLWKWFGTVNVTDTNLDYSGTGRTFAQDYSSSNAPTVFAFSGVSANSEYVNTTFANVQLDVAGTPYFIAVLVDDNSVSNAVWNTYSGSAIAVNLGTAERWHDVWIALRGHADDPTSAVWQYQRLKLDKTPPALVVTSPTNGTVAVPMIQLTGYSPEALSCVTYDLSNAAGTVTNQEVLILDQWYDPNTLEYTTNTFQAFDVTLTNGVNTFTLHATDMAGNVSTVVTNFVLDLSAKTNPAVQITWPQDGTTVSGSGTNFTLDGQMDDPTATVAVSISDSAGDTYTVYGAVERTGKFWVEEIPLNAGTNFLTLTVTDAAGRQTVTNLSVIQTSITFTMDAVTPDSQLWQSTVNLTGQISDTTYAVWVNGVKGHNNGDGTWYADDVPVNKGGTASFTMIGYAPDEQQPDGSYGN